MKTNENLCKAIKNNDQNAQNELYQNNLKLLYSLINRFNYRKSEFDDILSCAKIGLMNAALNYDDKYNCLFSTYAVPIILGEIKKYFRENSSLHISRGYKDLYRKIIKTQELLESKYQRNVSLNEIGQYLDLSSEDIICAYESHYSTSSLDEPLTSDGDVCLGDILSKSDEEIQKRNLEMAIKELDKKEQMIIKLRYYDGLTQEEVAKRFFISQVQVSRLEKKVIEKLKTLI